MSDSESKDSASSSPEEKDPQQISREGLPDEGEGLPQAMLRRMFGMGVESFTGPPWANPSLLNDIPPKEKAEILKGALDGYKSQGEQEARLAERKLDSETGIHRRGQWFVFGGLGVALVAVIVLSWMFLHYGKDALIMPVLTGLGGIVAGFAGGYGYARKNHNSY